MVTLGAPASSPADNIKKMSGYDALTTILLSPGLAEGASNPTYEDFHGKPYRGKTNGH